MKKMISRESSRRITKAISGESPYFFHPGTKLGKQGSRCSSSFASQGGRQPLPTTHFIQNQSPWLEMRRSAEASLHFLPDRHC